MSEWFCSSACQAIDLQWLKHCVPLLVYVSPARRVPRPSAPRPPPIMTAKPWGAKMLRCLPEGLVTHLRVCLLIEAKE